MNWRATNTNTKSYAAFYPIEQPWVGPNMRSSWKRLGDPSVQEQIFSYCACINSTVVYLEQARGRAQISREEHSIVARDGELTAVSSPPAGIQAVALCVVFGFAHPTARAELHTGENNG
jgi:hypothetical protein